MFTDAIQEKILNGIEQLAHALNAHRAAAMAYARTEHAYRQARANAHVEFAADGQKRTVDLTGAMVDVRCGTQMLAVRLAEAEDKAAKELVWSLRAQLSAAQSLLGAQRAEAEAVTYRQVAGA